MDSVDVLGVTLVVFAVCAIASALVVYGAVNHIGLAIESPYNRKVDIFKSIVYGIFATILCTFEYKLVCFLLTVIGYE